jgi:hypothetical protein
MAFVTELVVRQTGDDDWELVEDLVYEGRRERFVVPKRAATDFASVPQPFRWLIPTSGRHSKAAVLHDYLWRAEPRVCTYEEADGLFRRALHDLEVPLLRRWIMWAAVRWVSLFRTRFTDGGRDGWRATLVTIFPGLFVAAGGAIVLLLLLGFAVFEWVGLVIAKVFRRFGGKLPRVPAVIRHARPQEEAAKPAPPAVPPQPKASSGSVGEATPSSV